MSNEIQKTREDEIDLIDLLKVIVANKKIILVTWLMVLIVGLFFGFYMKDRKQFQANRKFVIRTIESETALNNDPISLYEDQNFIDKMLDNKIVKEKIKDLEKLTENSKKETLKGIYSVTKDNTAYVVKISGKDINEVRELEGVYFKELQEYLNANYGSILKKDLELQKKNSATFKNELLILENKISELAKSSKENYTMEDLKELHPTIFSEKESIATVYGENYKAQKDIENSIAKLNELIIYQSTLNRIEDKMSIKLIFIISNVLGMFLGIFIVFVREFLKGINWQDLKQLSK